MVYFNQCMIIYLIIGRPGFDSLTESDQKTLKVSIHSFLA